MEDHDTVLALNLCMTRATNCAPATCPNAAAATARKK